MKRILATWIGMAVAIPAFCADGPAWEKPFALRDANGLHMGRFLDYGVQLNLGKQRVLVHLAQGRQPDNYFSPITLDWPFHYIYYANAACTGQAYTDDYSSWGMPEAIVSAFDNGKVLLYPRGISGAQVTFRSVMYSDSVCRDGTNTLDEAVPLGDPIDITTLYRRPFTVE
jgi:hypothetical protein